MLAFYYWSIFVLSLNLIAGFVMFCLGYFAGCSSGTKTEKRVRFIFILECRGELIYLMPLSGQFQDMPESGLNCLQIVLG